MKTLRILTMLGLAAATAATTALHAADPIDGRVLEVDQRGYAPFKTIRQACMEAKAGDIIKLAPGSGPYREEIFIKASGDEGRPIIFDGSNETVTGFDVMTDFRSEGNTWVLDLGPLIDAQPMVMGFKKVEGKYVFNGFPTEIAALPGILTYKGKRVLQDVATGQLREFATLSKDARTLTLLPGVETEGWEFSRRPFVLRFSDASHHVYRNVKCTGSLNDGINGHGKGEDLVFENVEAFYNMDEGYSIHDKIVSEIRGGKFWGNDNGIANAPGSVLKATDLRIWGNLGYGFSIHDCSADLTNVAIWGNGIRQLLIFDKSTFKADNVHIYKMDWTTRPWFNYQESARAKVAYAYEYSRDSSIDGQVTTNQTEAPDDAQPVKLEDPLKP
ncbi:MAG: hypothetical protein ACAI35_24315 [Candidatus Methylacidiphilales bacterium]|nr:right-handed parallel beta-helix repeat-containing protein [Candidatus Methylacidiphilales bacterium]